MNYFLGIQKNVGHSSTCNTYNALNSPSKYNKPELISETTYVQGVEDTSIVLKYSQIPKHK